MSNEGLDLITSTDGEEVVSQSWSMGSGAEDLPFPVSSTPGIAPVWFRTALKQMHGLLGADEDEVDPLVALVRHEPVAAARFLQALMLAGGILSAVVCTVSWCLLFFRWGSCGPCCDRPLRLWLLVHTALQQCQVPARLYFSAKIFEARISEADNGSNPALDHRASLEACVVSFTASRTWRCARAISMLTYAWLALGIVWVMNSQSCEGGCPSGLRFTCITMMAIVGLRALCVAELFHKLFGSHGNGSRQNAQDCCEGASSTEVSALPCAPYSHIKCLVSHGTSHTGCVVCYSEYIENDILRTLPCGHRFHRTCVDKWLRRSTRCPLCMRSIRTPDRLAADATDMQSVRAGISASTATPQGATTTAARVSTRSPEMACSMRSRDARPL